MVTIGIIGRLGGDAISEDLGDTFAIKFNVCANVLKKRDGKYESLPQWYKVTYFRRSTAILPYLTKGTQVYVQGELICDTYVSKNTGLQMTSLQITADRVQLIGGKEEGDER